MKLNDAQLQRAASLADAIELSFLPTQDNCLKHTFSAEFEVKMQHLIKRVRQSEIKPYRVFMGYAYYAKRSIAAVLIAFLLACVTVPEAVIAGYHKLINVIENIVTEYTEYKYYSTVPGDTQFVPLEFGYLPEGMEVTRNSIDEDRLNVMYKNEQYYFSLKQVLITEDIAYGNTVDTEDAQVENKTLRGEKLDLIYKNEIITYVWRYGPYHISGICNLTIEELEKILDNLIVR